MGIAIITGASAGLGWAFARQLDQRDDVDELWLVARRRDRLEALADDLETRARVFAIDLTGPSRAQLFGALDAARPDVRWLVNNAGFGKFGPFEAIDVNAHLDMIDLNVRFLTELTQRTLPYLGRGSAVLQVASTAGYVPIPSFAVYAATKAYVVSLSHALASELKPRGVTVTAVCPGPVATEFQAVAGGSTTERLPSSLVADADAVVHDALRDADLGRLTSIHGAPMKAFAALSGLLPRRLVMWVTGRASG